MAKKSVKRKKTATKHSKVKVKKGFRLTHGYSVEKGAKNQYYSAGGEITTLETKITDLENRAKNKSLPESAVKKLNEMIDTHKKELADLKSKAESADPKFDKFKKDFEKKMLEQYGLSIGDTTDDDQLMSEFKDGATPQSVVDYIADKRNLEKIQSSEPFKPKDSPVKGWKKNYDFTDYERDVTEALEKLLKITTSDAQAIMEVISNEDILNKNFHKKVLPKDTAKQISDNSKSGKNKPSKKTVSSSSSDKTCDQLREAYEKRRAAAEKANKAHKTVSISEQIGDKIASVVGKALDNIPAADIKAKPGVFINKFERIEKSTKEFLDSLKSVLGDDFDRDELIEPFEKTIGEFIKKAKEKYGK